MTYHNSPLPEQIVEIVHSGISHSGYAGYLGNKTWPDVSWEGHADRPLDPFEHYEFERHTKRE